MGILSWFKNLLKQRPKEEFQLRIPKIEVTLEAKDKKEALSEANKAVAVMLKHEEWWKEVERPARLVPKAGQQATRQDVGKFMKHGHQAPWYRKSVKAKVKLEEED